MGDFQLPWVFPSGAVNPHAPDPQLTRDLLTVMRHRAARPQDGSTLTSQQIQQVIDSLPRLTEEQLDELGQHESSCPICMNTLLAAIAEEELALVMDSPAHPVEILGVTRLAQTCGHVFCRKDILTWIRDGHPSCPLCRTAFIKPTSTEGQSSPSGGAEAPPEDDDVLGDDAFDQAMARIVAAYHEERRQMGAPPTSFGPAQSAYGDDDTHTDSRDDYSGMYS